MPSITMKGCFKRKGILAKLNGLNLYYPEFMLLCLAVVSLLLTSLHYFLFIRSDVVYPEQAYIALEERAISNSNQIHEMMLNPEIFGDLDYEIVITKDSIQTTYFMELVEKNKVLNTASVKVTQDVSTLEILEIDRTESEKEYFNTVFVMQVLLPSMGVFIFLFFTNCIVDGLYKVLRKY